MLENGKKQKTMLVQKQMLVQLVELRPLSSPIGTLQPLITTTLSTTHIGLSVALSPYPCLESFTASGVSSSPRSSLLSAS